MYNSVVMYLPNCNMGYFTGAKWEILVVGKSDKFLAKACTFATTIRFERCDHLTQFFLKIEPCESIVFDDYLCKWHFYDHMFIP